MDKQSNGDAQDGGSATEHVLSSLTQVRGRPRSPHRHECEDFLRNCLVLADVPERREPSQAARIVRGIRGDAFGPYPRPMTVRVFQMHDANGDAPEIEAEIAAKA